MKLRFSGYRAVALVFWVLSVVTMLVWMAQPGFHVAWDLNVYKNAIVALKAGHDPYADGIAVQRAFHSQIALHPRADPPYTYVYSPITLPLLRMVGALPQVPVACLYWLAYAVGTLLAIWVALQFVEERERKLFTLLAPAAIFFPGLLQSIVLFSGNVAYIIYGVVFAAAYLGWRRGRWNAFYVAVLVASVFKAPFLTLLVIPVLSARRQWLQAGITGAVGVALFAVQPRIWPVAFHNYLEAVELQFSFNHDFSSSPAGVLANEFYDRIPYQTSSVVIYLAYAVVVFGLLLYLSRRFLAGVIPLERWVPVLLAGTVLLNPRVMEYDVAAIALPMALVMWRFFGLTNRRLATAVGMCVFFAVINIVGSIDGFPTNIWRTTECFVLVTVFVAGVYSLMRTVQEAA